MIARLHCRYIVAAAAQRRKTEMQPGFRALVIGLDDRPVALPLHCLRGGATAEDGNATGIQGAGDRSR
jgi:hypothetical protein